eukprot:scaffold23835_cov60-Phaeocystis_antarctica.AAC.6
MASTEASDAAVADAPSQGEPKRQRCQSKDVSVSPFAVRSVVVTTDHAAQHTSRAQQLARDGLGASTAHAPADWPRLAEAPGTARSAESSLRRASWPRPQRHCFQHIGAAARCGARPRRRAGGVGRLTSNPNSSGRQANPNPHPNPNPATWRRASSRRARERRWSSCSSGTRRRRSSSSAPPAR